MSLLPVNDIYPYTPESLTSSENSFKSFLIKNVRNINSLFIHSIAYGLGVCGTAAAIYSKKIHTISWEAPLVLLAGTAMIFFSAAVLCASDEVKDEIIHLKKLEENISQLENDGNYTKALELTEKCLDTTSAAGYASYTKIFTKKIYQLEEKLLTYGSMHLLFNEKFEPRIKLLNLLEMVGLQDSKSKSISEINAWAQANLLRKGERWDEQTNKFENLKSRIWPLFKDLGFIDSNRAHLKKYSGAIVHGTSLSKVRLNISKLVEAWKSGVRFERLYFFSGERPLNPNESGPALFSDANSPLKIKENWIPPSNLPKTECEMIQWVWQQADLPEEIRQIKIEFINAPMKDEGKTRPTTDDTIKAWQKTRPLLDTILSLELDGERPNYLAVSNQPYINRQDIVLRALASNNPKTGFETIGAAISEQENVAIVLDEVARTIFQINKLCEEEDKCGRIPLQFG